MKDGDELSDTFICFLFVHKLAIDCIRVARRKNNNALPVSGLRTPHTCCCFHFPAGFGAKKNSLGPNSQKACRRTLVFCQFCL